MKDFEIYWQDAIVLLAGVALALVLGFEISSLTIAEGWIVYVAGCLAAMFGSAGFSSKMPAFSWAAAVVGVITILTPLVISPTDNSLVLISMIAGGAVVTLLSAWSAVIKKNASKGEAKAS